MKTSKHIKQRKNKQKKTSYFNPNNKVKIDSSHLTFLNQGPFNPGGAMLMVDDNANLADSHLDVLKTQFDGSSKRLSDEVIYHNLRSIGNNVENVAVVLIAFQTAEESVKVPLPLSASCFEFLGDYLEGVRDVITSLSTLFSEDNVDSYEDKDICKAIESLKEGLCNINGIFSRLCKSVSNQQA